MNIQCSVLFVNIICLLILKRFDDLDEEEIGRYLLDLNSWSRDSKINQVIIKYGNDIKVSLAYYFWLKDYKDEVLYVDILFQPKYLDCVQSTEMMFSTMISKVSPSVIYNMFIRNNISQTRENVLLYIRDMLNQVPETNYEVRDSLSRLIGAIDGYVY